MLFWGSRQQTVHRKIVTTLREATGRPTLLLLDKDYMVQLTIVFILCGMAISYSFAVYNVHSFWDRLYFSWDKGKDCLLTFFVFLQTRNKLLKRALLLCLIFLNIRLCWEVCAIQNYTKASTPMIILSLFLIDITIMCLISIRPQFLKKSKWP